MKNTEWYKLDNMGVYYASTKDRKNPTVFRFTATMKDDVDVVNQGIGGTGIQLQVTNNNTHFIWLACEQLEVDDKSYDYSNMYLEHAYIPGRSTGIIYVNILGKNPDLVVSDIKELIITSKSGSF